MFNDTKGSPPTPGRERGGEKDCVDAMSKSIWSTADLVSSLRAGGVAQAISPLAQKNQWIIWKLKAKSDGKTDKIPLNIRTGKNAFGDHPGGVFIRNNCGSLEDALSALEKFKVSGIGFVLGEDDGIVGVDVDGCLAPGADPGIVIDTVEALDTYAEISPSGTGLRFFVLGELPANAKNKTSPYEIYDQGRFLTFTGRAYGELRPVAANQAGIDWFCSNCTGFETAGPQGQPQVGDAEIDPGTTPEIVLARAKRFYDEEFEHMLNGANLKFNGDPSSNDFSVVSRLVWCCGYVPDGQVHQIVDSLFRRSGRMRPKWDEKRGATTYGVRTINKAIEKNVERYMNKTQVKDKVTSKGADLLKEMGLTVKDVIQYSYDGQKGCADLFYRRNMGRFVFDHAAQLWYEFKGHSWVLDTVDKPVRALDEIQDIFRRADAELDGEIVLIGNELKNTEDEMKQDALKQRKKALDGQRKTVRGIINSLNVLGYRKQVAEFAAVGSHSLGISGDEWDRGPWVLAVSNGVVDLKSGHLRGGVPGDYIKSPCPTAYDPQTDCPTFKEFINSVFDNDEELVRFVQRFLGASVIGDANYKQFLGIMYGKGRNGKDTLLSAISHVLGEHLSGAISSELLLDGGKYGRRSSQGPSADKMRLRGLRLAWATETSQGRRFDSGTAKMLSGGGKLEGRPPFGKRNIEWDQTQLICILTNHKPHAPVDDYAFWKRVKTIPFLLSFVDDPDPLEDNERLKIPDLLDRMKPEAPGILKWLVDGCLDFQRNGLPEPAAVRAANEEYLKDEDLLGHFLDDCCVVSHQCAVHRKDFYQAYRKWSEENNHRPMTGQAFGRDMGGRFAKQGMRYIGVGLQSAFDDNPDF
jgi:putative DNA primase/helicase